jgi:ATP-dependent Clp protease ATP-binding subunit ClpA
MPKINVYLPDELAAAVREAQIPVSAVCQAALERAVRDVAAARGVADAPPEDLPDVGLMGRFTPRARQAVTLAQHLARDAGSAEVGTEHVLLGILDEGNNVALVVLADLAVDADDLRAELQAAVPSGEGGDRHVPFGRDAKQALVHTTKEALALSHNYIGCEHLLLGLLATEDGAASRALRRRGVELRTTRRAVANALVQVVSGRGQRLDQLVAQRLAPVPVAAPAPSAPGTPARPAEPDQATLRQILSRLDAIERRLGT